MSIVWADFPTGGVGLYGTTRADMLDGLYAQLGDSDLGGTGNVALVDDPDPDITGNVFRFNANSYGGGGNYQVLRYALPDGETTKVGIALRLWLASLPANSSQVPKPFRWHDGSNNNIAEVRVTTTGAINVYNNGSLVGTTGGPVITSNAWTHLEAVLDCDTGGSGSITLWVEGQEVISVTGLTTTDAGTSQIQVANDPDGTSAVPAMYIKDFVVWDGNGSQNNTQIGTCIVAELVPDADESSGWTSTGATNYGVLDEAPADDADYIEADDSPPAPSIVTMTDLPPDIVGVRGLVSVVRAWKTDGGDATLQIGLSPNGSDYDNGADRAITTSSTYWRDVSELSPATASAWTPTEVNALRYRTDRTA